MSYDQNESKANSLTNKSATIGPDRWGRSSFNEELESLDRVLTRVRSNPQSQTTLTRTVNASSTARDCTSRWQQAETNFSKENPTISTGSQANVDTADLHLELENKQQQAHTYAEIMGDLSRIWSDISHIRKTISSIYDKDPSQANTINVSYWDKLTDANVKSVKELEQKLFLPKDLESHQDSANPVQDIANEFASVAEDASTARTRMDSMLERADQAAKLRDTASEFADKLAGADEVLHVKDYLGLIPSDAGIAMSLLHREVTKILSRAQQESHDITGTRDFNEQTQSFTRMSEDYEKLHSMFYQSADDDDDDDDDVNGSQLNGIILALLRKETDLTKPWNLESPERPSPTPTSGGGDTSLASPRL